MSDYHKLPIRFRAAFDYGSRRGFPTKAFVVHMAEGTNVAQFLAGKPARGVSVHYCIEAKTSTWRDGQIVRILPEDRISGSINPDTIRRTNDPNGFYGVKHNRHALGAYWTNPNVATITVEVAGRAKTGPTPKQVASMVELFRDIDRRYGRVIPLGHRDFQSVKPCPGQTHAMKRAFAEMGGHGKDFDSQPERRLMSTRRFHPGQVCQVSPGAKLFNYPGGRSIGTIDGPNERYLLGYSPNGLEYALITTDLPGGNRTAWVRAGQVSNVRTPDPAGQDCTDARSAGYESALVRGIDALEGLRTDGP